MNKFEKKFGKYAINNLSFVLIMCYVIGYMIQIFLPDIVNYLTLNPYLILRGQIWRLITWILIPPPHGGIFVIFMLMFYYSIGNALERTWGAFQYNVYLFSGMLFTIIGSFVSMAVIYLFYGDVISAGGAKYVFDFGARFFSTYYVNMSIFLAFAATFPNSEVLLMFIIPLKVKWLGIIYGVMLFVELVQGIGVMKEFGFLNVFYRIAVIASLLNFVFFFFISRKRSFISPKQMKRKQQFRSEVRKNPSITKHKCAICGRTDESNPELEFRFCSKCDGNYEYCQDHLFTHEHVKK